MYYVEVDSSNSRRYGTATCGSLCFVFALTSQVQQLRMFWFTKKLNTKCQHSTNNKNYTHSFSEHLTHNPGCSDDLHEKKLPGKSYDWISFYQRFFLLFLQVTLFEIDCAIFYTNLHGLFCQFISGTIWVNSGKFIDNCWISCQVRELSQNTFALRGQKNE